MKKETDDYLGRGDNHENDKKKVFVFKHICRHKWLVENIDKVKEFAGLSSNSIVKSMMLTYEVIPTSNLRKEDKPLAILNFQKLKRKGVEYLYSAKEADLHTGT